MKFTYEAYATMLDRLCANGYSVVNYHNYRKCAKAVILRHDVDFNLEKAVELAVFEKEFGVQSTYYLLISSEFYNFFSKRSADCIAEIKACGHDIGLHFDEMRYNESSDIVKCMEAEIEIMESCLGESVRSISMHRPSRTTLEGNYVIKNGNVINSYGKEFFSNFKYLSDSRKCWREDVQEVIESGKHNKLHILTHPFWYERESVDMAKQLKDFCEKAKEERYIALQDNIRDLKSILPWEL